MPRIGPRQAAVFAAVGAPLMALPLLLSAAPQAPNDDQRPVSQRRSSASRGDDGARDASKSRLREGTRIENVIGYFRRNGDVATLVTEDDLEIGGLPNLNLERVVKMLKSVDEPESVYWSVSGEITEFSGRNYLLISRAVFKAAAPPPAPETISQ